MNESSAWLSRIGRSDGLDLSLVPHTRSGAAKSDQVEAQLSGPPTDARAGKEITTNKAPANATESSAREKTIGRWR